MISELKLHNWRNFAREEFKFSQKNVLIGPNGSGKSNMLEALGFLGLLRSFRRARTGEIIKLAQNDFALRAIWQKRSPRSGAVTEHELEVRVKRSGGRLLYVNKQIENSGRNFIQYFSPVFFVPEDIEIVSGVPGIRRRFFDMLASQLDDSYMNVLHDYHKTLQLRNLLLRSRKTADIMQLEVYEGLLAFAGADLTRRRYECVEEFNKILAKLNNGKETSFTVQYHPYCADGPETYIRLFDRMRKREIEKRTTLCGCQLDDFRIMRNGQPMKGFSSNGQNRMAALNCKLASAQMIMQKCGREKLIALVDDVTGELDEYRKAVFFDMLKNSGQIFFTFTERVPDKFFNDASVTELCPLNE